MERYIYEAGEYYDDLYDLYIILDYLEEKLNKNKLKKADRESLVCALNIIRNLEKY